MKRLMILLLVVLFYNISAYSQDTIITKSGEIILAKIINVNDTDILYKRLSYKNGANFIIKTENVSLIKWKNFELEIFSENNIDTCNLPYIEEIINNSFYKEPNHFTLDEFKTICTNNNILNMWKQFYSGRKLSSIGTGLFLTGLFMDVAGATLILTGVGGVILPIVLIFVGDNLLDGFILMLVGDSMTKHALIDYNKYAGERRNKMIR